MPSFKNSYTIKQLKKMGLNDRQVKAVQYVKDNTSITNLVYQKINVTGKTTATEDIQFLVDRKILKQAGSKDAAANTSCMNNWPVIGR